LNNGLSHFQILATDGLLDVLINEDIAKIVFDTLQKFPNEKHRYTMVAQELVAKSRGKATDSGHWRLSDLNAATVDDISVIVIPVYQYYKEFVQWEKVFYAAQQKRAELRNSKLQLITNCDLDTEIGGAVDDDDDEVEEAIEETPIDDDDGGTAMDKALDKINLNDSNGDEPSESTA